MQKTTTLELPAWNWRKCIYWDTGIYLPKQYVCMYINNENLSQNISIWILTHSNRANKPDLNSLKDSSLKSCCLFKQTWINPGSVQPCSYARLARRQFASPLRNNAVIMQRPASGAAALPHQPLMSDTTSKLSQCVTETRPGFHPAAAAAAVRLLPL